MDNETYEALVSVVKKAREYAVKMNKKKRKTQDDIFEQAILYRDIVKVENWISEVSKEHTN